MAASTASIKGAELSKAEYLKRYLSNDGDAKKSKGKLKKKRRKIPGKGLKIVDDDIDWKQTVAEENEEEEDDEEAPVIAEVIDERPDDVRMLEIFRSSSRWKVIGEDENEEEDIQSGDLPEQSSGRKTRHDSPDASPPRRPLHDSPDMSPPRKKRHNSPDQSPPRRKKQQKGRRDSDSDLSPPRWGRHGGKVSDDDLSPPRRNAQTEGNSMLSGGKAGLVSSDVLRMEKEEARRRDGNNKELENASRHAQTVFRDKSGKKRDLESEREEQKRKAGEKAAKDEKYAQWGKGLAQGQMEQQRLEDAVREAQKPLARNRDDEDLDRMLREQVRDGDPMAAMLRRKKERKTHGVKEKPQYRGPPPPPNRFNLLPGYRWDGVNRSNGFEQKRYTRIADKKALQEEAYKWSVEDM
ncbi:BUD13 homolog isoform X1 [Vanacampus margaritifer]